MSDSDNKQIIYPTVAPRRITSITTDSGRNIPENYVRTRSMYTVSYRTPNSKITSPEKASICKEESGENK